MQRRFVDGERCRGAAKRSNGHVDWLGNPRPGWFVDVKGRWRREASHTSPWVSLSNTAASHLETVPGCPSSSPAPPGSLRTACFCVVVLITGWSEAFLQLPFHSSVPHAQRSNHIHRHRHPPPLFDNIHTCTNCTIAILPSIPTLCRHCLRNPHIEQGQGHARLQSGA